MSANLEREIKLRFDSPGTARRAVAVTGATLLHPRRLQHDCLLDTADQRMLQQRSALRVRRENDHGFVTFKGPAQNSPMKLREEIETGVGDPEVLLGVLERLGFQVWFRYEKYREEYRTGDVVIAIDETPIGTFVEIEGSEDGINQTARAMGTGPADYIRESYRALFVKACTERGVPVTNMLFDPAR